MSYKLLPDWNTQWVGHEQNNGHCSHGQCYIDRQIVCIDCAHDVWYNVFIDCVPIDIRCVYACTKVELINE